MILYFSNEVSMLITHYIHEFTYNEEAQLLGISHCGTLTYEYAYGADGNRRWSKDIANNRWTWYPCGVACGAGEMVEETSTLTGSSWSVSSQYLRAGGGCSSMLIRQNVPNMNDEYHHLDIVGMYPILTDASANVLRSYVFDAYAVPQSQQQFIGESYPVQSNHNGSCSTTIAEPGMSSSPSGGAVLFQARVLHVASKKSKQAKPCHSSGISRQSECQTGYHYCKDQAKVGYVECVGGISADGVIAGGIIGGIIGRFRGGEGRSMVGAGVGTVLELGGGTAVGAIGGGGAGTIMGAITGGGVGSAIGGAIGIGIGKAACTVMEQNKLKNSYKKWWGCVNNPDKSVLQWFPD